MAGGAEGCRARQKKEETAMIHMVFMKMEPGILTEEVLQMYRDTYAKIQADLPEHVLQVEILRNCVERDQNMDLMIRLHLAGRDSLAVYLQNADHIAIGQKMNPHVLKIASFDYEE